MALYDNRHWLLSHIRDSFISSDDSGMCEMAMVGEDIPKQLKITGEPCYPGDGESDEEGLGNMSDSYDVQTDGELGFRPGSNNAQYLQQLEMEKELAEKAKNVKWEPNVIDMTDDEKKMMFKRKDFRNKNTIKHKRQSLLAEQLENTPFIPPNPYTDYQKFDGSAQIGVPTRKYRIFMCMLSEEERRYPLQIAVQATAKVQEFVGLICYKYASEHPNHNLMQDVTQYGLYITEDDGEVDWDFPCLDPREAIGKFEFASLCLAEMCPADRARHDPSAIAKVEEDSSDTSDSEPGQHEMDLMELHTIAMSAPLYKSYRVYIINKVRAKTEIQLGISCDKIEIDPVITGKGASRFWHRQRAVSYPMENIAWCELGEVKGSKTTFTLIYTQPTISDTQPHSSPNSHPLHQSTSFKTHEFETHSPIAEEIVKKIENILELRSTPAKREFIAYRDRKAARRKSFHLNR